jgi:hypothetical protein
MRFGGSIRYIGQHLSDRKLSRMMFSFLSMQIKSRGSTRQVDKEKSYCLNHSSGIVVAQVFGPDLKFT